MSKSKNENHKRTLPEDGTVDDEHEWTISIGGPMYASHHGFSLIRDHETKDVVKKVMSPNTNFDEIVV